MSKKVAKFQFKQFAVDHHRSSMKVGVDGVMVACWTDVSSSYRILDVGTGCGLIALIMAQRTPCAKIDAIDIDKASIEEASENIKSSPWRNRINAILSSYSMMPSFLLDSESKYDLIISNPPYFDSGVTEMDTPREKARHQGELSPSSLLQGAKELLNQDGSVSMVIPTDISEKIERMAEELGFLLIKKCYYRGHSKAPYKRVLLQWKLQDLSADQQIAELTYLTLEKVPGQPTDEYRELCKEFYLRF